MISARRDGARPCPNGTSMVSLRKSRSYVHREERGTSPRPEQPPARSQHGELGRQSTQNVGVDDRIERLLAKGQSARARHYDRGLI